MNGNIHTLATATRRMAVWAFLGGTVALAGCGGGGNSGAAPAPTLPERTAAAQATANHNALCTAIAPFHWSLGDGTGRLADGITGTGGPDALTAMNIASASKLLYSAWVAEQRNGVFTTEDVRHLNFTSGYTEFSNCLRAQTVAQCQAYLTNGDHVAGNDGKFFYNGGHMQKHATLMGIGADDNTALARDISSALGNIGIPYSQPQLAGGVVSNATEYGLFLQRTVAGQTKIAALLGSHPVCTNPLTCATALSTPIPTDESWHYSVGHWVEDDPVVGDGAFSSPGAFGFYPWISADKKWWGIVARHQTGGAIESMKCGREIRAAWVSGVAR